MRLLGLGCALRLNGRNSQRICGFSRCRPLRTEFLTSGCCRTHRGQLKCLLNMGMKLLPKGRKSSLAIVLYSSIVGVATFILQYLSGLLRSILLEIGISEDMHNPLGVFFIVCLILAGAWFGYWGVRKLVLTDDGSVDSEVAYFVEWAILIFAAVMILQSSLDTLLAAQTLNFAIMTRAISRINRKTINTGSEQPRARARNFKLTPHRSPVQGSTQFPPESGSYYSSFHKTPERKKFSREEWEKFTKEQTREALRDLVSSLDFSQWAVANAERMTLTPPEVTARQRKRLFRWF